MEVGFVKGRERDGYGLTAVVCHEPTVKLSDGLLKGYMQEVVGEMLGSGHTMILVV